MSTADACLSSSRSSHVIEEMQLSLVEDAKKAKERAKAVDIHAQLALAAPTPDLSLAPITVPNPYPTRDIPGTVLEDEDYEDAVDSIIERDYFPDLKRLRIESELLLAKNTNDFATAHRLKAELENALVTPMSVRAPDTPMSSSGHSTWSGGASELDDAEGESRKKPQFAKLPSGQWIRLNTDVRLDTFQRRYTSNENASFEALIIKDKKRRRDKEGWIEERELQHNKRVAVSRAKTDTRNIAIPDSLKGVKDLPVISTKHEARNALIFPVLNVPKKQGEYLSSKPAVQFKNTRLPTKMQRVDKLPEVLQKRHDKMLQNEKDNIYNAALFFSDPKNVNANGGNTPFQFEPKAADGNKSPPMTYGKISSTPQVIETMDKYQFRMREPTERDIAAEKLEKKAKLKQREKVSKTTSSRLKALGIRKDIPTSLLTPASLAASSREGSSLTLSAGLNSGAYTPVRSLFRNAQRAAKMIMRNTTPRSSCMGSRASSVGSQTPLRTPLLGSDLPKNITDGLLQ